MFKCSYSLSTLILSNICANSICWRRSRDAAESSGAAPEWTASGETVARHKNELSLQILEPSYVVSLVLRRQSWSLKTQTGLHKVVIQSHTHTGSTVRNATRRRYYHKAPPPPLFHQFDLFSVFHLRLSILLCVSLSLSL